MLYINLQTNYNYKLLFTATTTAPPVQAPIRLQSGSNQFEGRVEIYYNGTWGTICDDNWDIIDARYNCLRCHTKPLYHFHLISVVCRQLGFGDALRAYTGGYFGGVDTSIPIHLDEVQCSASDHYLSECRHNGWGNNDCSHTEDAGVACTGSSKLTHH